MALINCMECNKEISPMASYCPACGHPNQQNNVRLTEIDIGWGSLINFMVKFAIATIPAAIILGIFAAFAVAIVTAMVRGT